MVEQAASGADDPGSLVLALGEIVAGRLEASDYRSGSAIATMVLELAPGDEGLSAEFDHGFGRWRAALSGRFESWGVTPERAVILADLVMSTLEGALLPSHAARNLEPLHRTTAALAEIIDREHASPAAAPSSRSRAPRPRAPATKQRSQSR